jgi:hypothetical protein
MGIKKVGIFFLVICFLLVSMSAVSCFLFGGAEETGLIQTVGTSEEESNSQEEEIDVLMENEDFLDVLGSFDYEGSTIKEAKRVYNDEDQNEDLFFILLESTEDFKDVENYYKDIKVKSIWIRSEIFEKSSKDVEEEFIDPDDESIPVSKFTYSDLEKDKVVNVLIKGLEESRTQIMIIYWDLQ